ncbi:hypothetical protein WMY93_015676 [Mugilogobius chulae]|uniref:Secreted protein n=1 Tax=Mugilogobius chulae TaxID=88201 RepID=A0AAW0P0X2_9GOBI
MWRWGVCWFIRLTLEWRSLLVSKIMGVGSLLFIQKCEVEDLLFIRLHMWMVEESAVIQTHMWEVEESAGLSQTHIQSGARRRVRSEQWPGTGSRTLRTPCIPQRLDCAPVALRGWSVGPCSPSEACDWAPVVPQRLDCAPVVPQRLDCGSCSPSEAGLWLL